MCITNVQILNKKINIFYTQFFQQKVIVYTRIYPQSNTKNDVVNINEIVYVKD